MKKTVRAFICLALCFCMVFLLTSAAAATNDGTPEQIDYGFIDSNGVKIEYGVYGLKDGEPLVLLPPNGGDMHSFDTDLLPEMAKHFKVITISPRSTGKSDRGTGKLTFDAMSADLVNVLDFFGIQQTYIFGFSDGGNLGLVFTVQHQDRVKKLAVMGANINPLGTKTVDQIGIIIKFLTLNVAYIFTKDPETARRRDIEGLMVDQPTLQFSDLEKITVPVLNMFGEFDMIKRSHSKKITKSIPGAQELMIVGGGHSSCFQYTDTVIAPALLSFYGVQ